MNAILVDNSREKMKGTRQTVVFDSNTEDILYLASCIINDIPVSQARMSSFSIKNIYLESHVQKISALIYTAFECGLNGNSQDFISERDKALLKKWEIEQIGSLYREESFNRARESIQQFCEESGIWYMPLKGIVLKEYYPYLGMREMSDNDILFDEKYAVQVHDWFVGHGYTVRTYQHGNHDVYCKNEICFEMHKRLFGTQDGDAFWKYYYDVKDRLLPAQDSKWRFCFRDEDLYVYMMAHAYKHGCGEGVDLRMLLDLYLFVRAQKDELDWEYIERQLTALKLADFGCRMKRLTECIFLPGFSPESMDDESRDFLEEIIVSGTGGIVENRVENRLQALKWEQAADGVKAAYVLKRLFPSVRFMREFYPFCRFPLLLPVAYVYRLARQSILNTTNLIAEFKTLIKK